MLKASVIIPARNRESVLPETLRALARQSFPAEQLEVVVVDDGSTDDIRAAISAHYPFRVIYDRLHANEEFCPARPRNRGLRLAGGDIAIFLDADVVPGPEFVAEHVAAHCAENRASAVVGYTYGYPLMPEDRTPEVLDPPPPDRILESLNVLVARDERWRDGREPLYAASRDLADHVTPWQAYWTNNASVPRDTALQVGGFDEDFVGWGAEDFEFAYRLHLHGLRFALARQAWGVHYPHAVGDQAVRRRQLERNRRRLIAKHASPLLELQLWDWQAWQDAWAETRPILEAPGSPAPHSRGFRSILDRITQHVFAPGSILWCGMMPATPTGSRERASCCWPFAHKPLRCASVALPLLGVFTPWEDLAFGGCLIADYWRGLSTGVVTGMLKEMTRLAPRVALLCTRARPTGRQSTHFRTLEECSQLLRSLLPDFRFEVLHAGDATAFLVNRSGSTMRSS